MDAQAQNKHKPQRSRSAAATNTTVSASPSSFYSVGADNRGCATITASGTTFQTRFELGQISGITGAAGAGQIMEFDPAASNAYMATGRILLQNPADFAGLPAGGYVQLLTGWDSTLPGRMVCGGVLANNTSGILTYEEQSCNDAGTLSATGPIVGTAGSYSSIDAHGRFTENSVSNQLVAYYVSATAFPELPNMLLLTTTAANPILAGEATLQNTASFNQSSFTGPYALFANGVNNSSSGKIFFAQATANGVSTLTVNQYHENDGGTWVPGNPSPTYTYAVDSFGGVALSTGTVANAGHIYLTGNVAVYIGVDSGAFAGFAAPQTGSGSFGNGSLDGNAYGGTLEIINQGAQCAGEIVTPIGVGNVSVTSDLTSTTSQQAGQTNTEAVTVALDGTFTAAATGSQVVGILIDSYYFVMANSISSSYPTIALFGPHTPPP